MAQGSAVISTGQAECSIRATDTLDNPRVALKFGDVTVFFQPDDAHEIGAHMIAIAATISTAFNPSLARSATSNAELGYCEHGVLKAFCAACPTDGETTT